VTLLQAHRILIGAAILLFVLYAGLALSGRLPGGSRSRLTQGAISLLVAAGLGTYLWRLGRPDSSRRP
jgi:hypothetical protein